MLARLKEKKREKKDDSGLTIVKKKAEFIFSPTWRRNITNLEKLLLSSDASNEELQSFPSLPCKKSKDFSSSYKS
jgi:hypothetical protein